MNLIEFVEKFQIIRVKLSKQEENKFIKNLSYFGFSIKVKLRGIKEPISILFKPKDMEKKITEVNEFEIYTMGDNVYKRNKHLSIEIEKEILKTYRFYINRHLRKLQRTNLNTNHFSA